MLSFMRKFVASWVGVAILGVVILAFVVTLFYGQGPSGGGTGPQGAVLAKVGDETLAEAEYVRAFDRAVRRERQQNPQITNADFIRLGGFDAVLEDMIRARAFKALGDSLGLVVSKRAVDGEIASVPAFQANGRFDEATFRRVLADQRLNEAEVRELLSGDLAQRKLLVPVALGATVPNSVALPYANLLLEQRRGSVLAVPNAAMPAPAAPTDAQLTAFYNARKVAYTLPERRAFRFALVDNAALAAKSAPTEAEIAAYYKENAAEFGGVERRVLNGVVLQDRAGAERIAAAVRGGQSFAQAAAAAGFGAGDIVLGSQTQQAFAAASSPQVASAVFAAQPGAVVGPLQSPLGFHVVQVARIEAAQSQALAAARPKIVATLTQQKTEDALADLVGKAEDRLSGGESLADVARSYGLPVQQAPAMTADGRVQNSPFVLPDAARPLLAKVFQADPADGPQVAELAKGQFALFEVGDVVPPAAVPLAQIRPAVAADWANAERAKAARALADRLAAELAKGGNPAALAAANRLPAPQTVNVRRLELTQLVNQGQQVPPPIVVLLNTPVGKSNIAPAPGNQGWFVVRNDQVVPGNAAQVPQLVGAVRSGFTRDAEGEVANAFVRAVERQVGTVRNQANIDALKRRLSGETLAN